MNITRRYFVQGLLAMFGVVATAGVLEAEATQPTPEPDLITPALWPSLVLIRVDDCVSPANEYVAQAFANYCHKIGVELPEKIRITPQHRMDYGNAGWIPMSAVASGHRSTVTKYGETGIVTFGGPQPKNDHLLFPQAWLINADYAFVFSSAGVRVIKDRVGETISGFRDVQWDTGTDVKRLHRVAKAMKLGYSR